MWIPARVGRSHAFSSRRHTSNLPTRMRHTHSARTIHVEAAAKARSLSPLPDLVDLFFKRELINRRQRQRKKQTYSAIENGEGLTKSTIHLLLWTLDGRWVRHSPMRRHRLTDPHRAGFLGRVITHRKNKVELRGARSRKFVPALAPQTGNWNSSVV